MTAAATLGPASRLHRQIVFVKFVVSHPEYEAIDALTVPSFNERNHANPPDPHRERPSRRIR